jgi:hypothetical protein
MNMCRLILAAGACAVLLIASHATLSACPVCYGAQDTSTTQSVNAAILSLLGVTGGVLGGFATMFVRLRRRARMFAGQIPPTDQDSPGKEHQR